ncbi:T9SS type A sorting domain-containing protein [Rhodocytophaga rosea]|uniref:T9SS type A sorting domain-containing protein n=1 Tax=Rhodocytophaga rosea TaxID=2704465 RepID=A0A6C0GKF9_9BACT|nr:CotH kinase family protein [Rhodocytophaga rosea]QHT68561.1 T9SS type A sorting domain-containing protein [Rhodocytophaga rosea]
MKVLLASYFTGIFLLINSQFLYAQTVVINEIMASNQGILEDEDGDTPDWIELFNTSTVAVNLENWSITDDSLEIDKWVFPAVTLQPGSFLIVFASDKDRKGEVLHTGFKIGAGRESVYLYNNTQQRVDEFTATCIPTGFSFGHKPDGSGLKTHLTIPSPGNSNNQSPVVTVTPGKDTLIFSAPGGFYTQAFSLTLSVNSPETRIFYTTDGSEPDESALLYQSPISIENRKGQENDVSDIETSPAWIPPKGEVFKGTVIRAIAYIDGCPASQVITHTYFVDEHIQKRYTLPVVSIATDRSDFFGKKNGIYVIGENDGLGENFIQSGREWERQIHLEFFDEKKQLGFKQELGARIHGRGSRGNPQKSVRVYARDDYGKDRISYKLFPDLNINRFKTLIFRTPDADFSSTIFKDELVQTIIRDMNLDLQATRPSVVFINGEYWGIHNIRERQDKDYIASHHNVDPDNLDILGLALEGTEIIEGDETHYNAMLGYIADNDLQNPVHYQYITTQMDVGNFIDYQIAQIFFANYDWPINNVRYWRPKTPQGKWRWLFFDCDACMIQDTQKHLVVYTSKDKAHERFDQSTFLLRSLLKNESFRKQFLQRFMYHLNTTFEPGRVMGIIEQFKKTYAPEVFEHVYRWNNPSAYNHWLENIEEIRLFTLNRPPEMYNQITSLFALPFSVFPNPTTGVFTVDLGEAASFPVRLNIFTTPGKQVYSNEFKDGSILKNTPIQVSNLPKGLYLLKIQYGNLIYNQKLVIH